MCVCVFECLKESHKLSLTTMSVMISSSSANWTRSLQKQRQVINKRQVDSRSDSQGCPSVGQVPVQRGDESPGAVLLLQQPADSSCFTVLTRSEDHRLQHVHLKYGDGETVSNKTEQSVH